MLLSWVLDSVLWAPSLESRALTCIRSLRDVDFALFAFSCRILGVIAMIDDDETDWKVLTIAMDDDRAQLLGNSGVEVCFVAWLEPCCQGMSTT